MKQPDKNEVILAVKNRILSMLNTVTESLDSERNAIQQETKSSAGDKYETQREMLQADIRRSEAQLEETKNHLEIIDNLYDFHGSIMLGTVVHLDQGSLKLIVFVGPAVGDIEVQGIKLMFKNWFDSKLLCHLVATQYSSTISVSGSRLLFLSFLCFFSFLLFH
jgi:hypothetical protein